MVSFLMIDVGWVQVGLNSMYLILSLNIGRFIERFAHHDGSRMHNLVILDHDQARKRQYSR